MPKTQCQLSKTRVNSLAMPPSDPFFYIAFCMALPSPALLAMCLPRAKTFDAGRTRV